MRTPHPALGHHLTLAVRHREEFRRAECKFHLPPGGSGEVAWYSVQNGQVVDDTGEVVDGVEAWDDGGDPTVCGIKIHAMQPEHQEEADPGNGGTLGWRVELRFESGGVLGQPRLDSISVEIHLLDELVRPRLQDRFGLQPLHYSVSLEPDLKVTNATTHFTGTVVLELEVIQPPGFLLPLHLHGLEIRQVVLRERFGNSGVQGTELHGGAGG